MQAVSRFIVFVCRHFQSPISVWVVNPLLVGLKYLIQLKDKNILSKVQDIKVHHISLLTFFFFFF